MHTDVLTVEAPAGSDPDPRTMPLTWAQASMWQASWEFGDEARFLVMRLPVPLPGPLPESIVREVLGSVCGLYDVARTRFPREERHQRVEPTVGLPTLVLDSDVPPAAGTAALADALGATPFDPAAAPPLRVGLLRRGGLVHAVVLAFSHLAFDIAAARLLRDQVAAAFAHPGATLPDVRQTGELVALEASGDSRTRSDATISRWERAVRAGAPGPGMRPCAPGSHPVLQLRSVDLAAAAQALAPRLRVSAGSVVLAGVVRAFAAETGRTPPVWQLIVGNRHHGPLADLVGITAQNGPFTTPPSAAATPLHDLVAPVHRGAVHAYINARYDTDALHRRVAALAAAGDACDLSYFFNDARLDARGWDALPAGPDSLGRDGDAAPVVVSERSVSDSTAFVSLGADGPTAVLSLQVDESAIDRDTAGRVLSRVRDEVMGAVTGHAPVALR